MSKSIFITLLHANEKEAGLVAAIGALAIGEESPAVHAVEPAAFGAIPGAPFAYWASEQLRSLFKILPPFEGAGRTAKQGLATADDFRFVRTWWEVSADKIVTGRAETTQAEFRTQTFQGKRWVPFAKGGAFSPYYADLHLVVNWERDGEEMVAFPGSVIRNSGYYFRPGLTWPRRTTSGISIRSLPPGAIFADKGPAAFVPYPLLCLALMQSKPFGALISLQLGAADAAARSYEVGIIQRVPIPAVAGNSELGKLVEEAIRLKQALDTANEISHTFTLPALLQVAGSALAERGATWQSHMSRTAERLNQIQDEADLVIASLYGIALADCNSTEDNGSSDLPIDPDGSDEAEADGIAATFYPVHAAADLISYIVGIPFGRWIVQENKPEPFDPLAPLPVYSPGMRQEPEQRSPNHGDSPTTDLSSVAWDGILVEDEGHSRDLVVLVEEQLSRFFQNPFVIQRELCHLLGTRSLRTWLAQKFFAQHIRRYSMSRRKAPIYWQLSSARKHYGLWLYYHRLNKDTLYVALRDYVGPKLAHEEEILQGLKAQLAEAKLKGHRDELVAHQVEAQDEVVRDVADFRDGLKAVADAGYDPDLNDGVLINIAPLHKLVPWKEAAACYKELKAGKYSWSSMHQRYTFR